MVVIQFICFISLDSSFISECFVPEVSYKSVSHPNFTFLLKNKKLSNNIFAMLLFHKM